MSISWQPAPTVAYRARLLTLIPFSLRRSTITPWDSVEYPW